MKQFKPKEIIKFLEKNGWEIDHQSWSHCILYHEASRKRTTVPIHKKDIPIGTLMAILKQTGFKKGDLLKK